MSQLMSTRGSGESGCLVIMFLIVLLFVVFGTDTAAFRAWVLALAAKACP